MGAGEISLAGVKWWVARTEGLGTPWPFLDVRQAKDLKPRVFRMWGN